MNTPHNGDVSNGEALPKGDTPSSGIEGSAYRLPEWLPPLLRRAGAWILTFAIIAVALLVLLHLLGIVLGLLALVGLVACLVELWLPDESRLVRQWLRGLLCGSDDRQE